MVTLPARAHVQMRASILRFLPTLIFIVTVIVVNKPALLKADDLPCPPSTLVVYMHQKYSPPNATTVTVVSPSAASGGPLFAFGSIQVLNNILRESAAADSPVLGATFGIADVAIDLSIYISTTFVLSSPSYAGSISLQGVTDPLGVGELGITAGTGDFRFARGYADGSGVYITDAIGVYKIVFHIKYD